MKDETRLLYLAIAVLAAAVLNVFTSGCATASLEPDFQGAHGELVYTGGYKVSEDLHNGTVLSSLDLWVPAFESEGLQCDIMGTIATLEIHYRQYPFQAGDDSWVAGLYHLGQGVIDVGFLYPSGGVALGHELGHAFFDACGMDSTHPDCSMQDPECCNSDLLCSWALRYRTPY